ncbi:glycosyltransferase family 4 protein [Vagococcus fluvialis]|uniref:glycosyltransferase family 4 protein n=1 Tax=Vagococcus fluvialis TaxID=2738 RepID=UPI003B5C0A93
MKKKILIFHHYGGIGGAGVSLLHIVKNIDLEKFDVSVACPSQPNSIYLELRKLNVNVIKLEKPLIIFNHYNGGINYLFSLRGLKNLYKLIKNKAYIKNIIIEENPDIVVVNSMTLSWIGKIANKLRKETICFHRETYKQGTFNISNRVIKKNLSVYFSKVIFISEFDKVATLPINGQAMVVYDRVDISIFKEGNRMAARNKLNLESDVNYVLYVGGPSKLKGYHVLLKAIKYLKKEKNIKFILLGFNDTEESIIRNEIENLEINSLLLFYEATMNPELFYRACDMIVFPSTKAHQARPIYEAGISRIPIIISDFENTKEFAENKISAFTFEPSNSRDLAIKIKNVIYLEKSLKDKILDTNYERAMKKHDLSKLSEDIQRVFQNGAE